MLEIIIDNVVMDLPPDIQISITVENPFMLADRIPTPYSLNFELPDTPKNLKQFGWPNRITAYKTANNSFTTPKSMEIRFNSIEILKGQVNLVPFSQSLKLRFIGIDYNEFLKQPLNTLDLGRKYFEGSYSHVNYDDPMNWAYSYKQWANELALATRPDMLAAPMVFPQDNQPFSKFTINNVVPEDSYLYQYYNGQPTIKLPYIVQDLEYINAYNPLNQNFIIKPHPSDNSTVTISQSHASIFPAFRVGYLLDVIFGNMLVNNPFRENELNDLVLPTYYFPTWKERRGADYSGSPGPVTHFPPMVSNPRPSVTDPYPSQPYLELSDFLPSTPANEFIRMLLNLFGMTLIPQSGKLKVVANSSIINKAVSKNWSNKVMQDQELNKSATEAEIYAYGYAEAKTVEINMSDSISSHFNYVMMDTPYTLDGDKYYERLFQSFDQIYTKRVSEETVNVTGLGTFVEIQPSYDLLDSGFNKLVTTDKQNKFDMTSPIKPLPVIPADYFNYIHNRPLNNAEWSKKNEWEVAALINVDRTQRPSEIVLSFFQGRHFIKGDENTKYPFLNSVTRFLDIDNRSLNWEGGDGLFNRYHQPFAQWKEREKAKISATLLLNSLDLYKLDITDKVHIDGRNFFIEKMQYTIGFDQISPVQIDFLEA